MKALTCLGEAGVITEVLVGQGFKYRTLSLEIPPFLCSDSWSREIVLPPWPVQVWSQSQSAPCPRSALLQGRDVYIMFSCRLHS